MMLGFAVHQMRTVARLRVQIDRIERELGMRKAGRRFTFVIGPSRVIIHD